MIAPLAVLAAVVALIAVRQVGRVRLQIWQVMLGGAAAMLATGAIGPRDALRALDLEVMLFLAGMFVVGRALEVSGRLGALSQRCFQGARSVDGLVLRILVGSGLASALLMNDTLAIVGTPVVVGLARAHRVPARLTLLALAFGVTAGSVLSPIGNPQNLLVALAGDLGNPFVAFLRALALPAAGALALSHLALRVAFRGAFHGEVLVHAGAPIHDRALARLAGAALVLLVALVALRIALVSAGGGDWLRLTAIALAPAALVLALSPRRIELARGIDWPTLAFFAALFVVVAAVERSGAPAEVVARLGPRVGSVPWILAASALLSQIVSNVPLVALALPAVTAAGGGAQALMALAAGSTLAGNLTLVGAASNVIVVDLAERRFGERVSFWAFTRVGAPLAVAQLLLAWALLARP